MSAASDDFWRRLPKIELHCHFGGVARAETVAQLFLDQGDSKEKAWRKAGGVEIPANQDGLPREPKVGFRAFQIISEAHGGRQNGIERIANQLVQDLHNDGVIYAEIRTGGANASKVAKVLSAMEQALQSQQSSCTVRYILSIKRDAPVSDARLTVDNAIGFKDRGVVAVDFCGCDTREHPFTSEVAAEIARAKLNGLAFCPHFAELERETDLNAILAAGPSRLGHGIFMNDEIFQTVYRAKIPIECCLASNLNTMNRDHEGIDPRKSHPIQNWYAQGHPFVLCTDNPGLLAQWPLSEHYRLTAEILKLSKDEIWKLAFSAVDHAFADESVKHMLRAKFKEHKF